MLFTIVLSAVLGQAAQTPSAAAFEQLNPKRDMVLSGDKAYALLPPKLVAEGKITQLEWSMDGRYLMYVRKPRPRDYELLLPNPTPLTEEEVRAQDVETIGIWDSSSGQSRELSTSEFGAQNAFPEQIRWLHGANLLLAVTQEVVAPSSRQQSARYRLMRITPSGDSSVIVEQDFPRRSSVQMKVLDSPRLPFAILEVNVAEGKQHAQAYRLIRGDGSQLPINSEAGTAVGFSGDGKASILRFSRDPATKAKRVERYAINEKTGGLTPSSEPFVAGSDPRQGLAVSLVQGRTPITSGKASANIEVLWLKATKDGEHSGAYVASESKYWNLSFSLNMVAYESQGYLFARPIVAMPADAFKKALLAQEHIEAMNRAKQVATAVFIYAADYDNKFPSSSGFASMIGPYLGSNQDLLEGFHYSLNGQDSSGIANPADSVMGYIQMSDGQVVAYADGHVGFRPR